ncbi:signal peptidase II [Anaerotignum sp.]|uniref:signal peptidase II n=1 Tax=Anaerotignum sp. TaxID=2039241 RepID=UPI0028A7A352|nr:signal peptidase II [Anaerotignum sp.]
MKNILVFLGVLGLDLGTKKWADASLPLGKRRKVSKNLLYFQHIKNYGMAYHKLAGKKNIILSITGAFTAIYSFLFLGACFSKKDAKRYGIPLAITLGGAYGNFLERWKKGYVTDFIYIKKGRNAPIFNIADAALLFGAVLVGIMSLKDTSNM